MAHKKLGKDILEDILTGEHDHHVPGIDELTQLISNQVKPIPTKPKQPNKPSLRHKKRAKKKTTYYLSKEVFEELGEARDTLKNMLPEEDRSQISKSGIVDAALKMILQELADKGTDSVLLKQLKEDKKDK